MSFCMSVSGIIAFIALFYFVSSDDVHDAGQRNLLHDSKVTHDKELVLAAMFMIFRRIPRLFFSQISFLSPYF